MSDKLSIGAELKQARLAKKISLDEVFKKTKIHISILNAIEEDRLRDFSPTYMRGFLKLYAQFLGLHAEEILSRYQSMLAPKVEATVKKAEKLQLPKFDLSAYLLKIKMAGAVIVAIFVLVFFVRAVSGFIHKRRTVFKPPAKIAAAPKKPAAKKETPAKKESAVKKEIVAPKPAAAKKAQVATKEEAAKKETVTPVAAPQIAAPSVATPSIATPTVSKQATASVKKQQVPVNLAIGVNDDSWVAIVCDGTKIYEGILKKGMKESWSAKNEIRLSVGNAGGINIEVNGKVLSPLGRKGQVLKDVIITSQGVSTVSKR